MKKLTTILLAIVSVIIIAFLLWFFFLRNPNIPVDEAIRDILPFGSGEDIDIDLPPPSDPLDSGEEGFIFGEFSSPVAKLFRLSSTPIAGATAFEEGGWTIVRYADRGTGHIYDIALPETASSSALQRVKVTNTTLPKIYEAHFRSNGEAVVFRSLKDDGDVVINSSLTISPPEEEEGLYSISSTLLRGDITDIAAGSGDTLFYVLRDSSSIVSSNFDGTGEKTLLSSRFSNWRLAPYGNSLIVYTKASNNAQGIAYTLSTSGSLRKILGPLEGLVVMPDDSGSRVLYSYVEGGNTKLAVKNLQDGSVGQIPFSTLAEKCLWDDKGSMVYCGVPTQNMGSNEPDEWYRGETHFSDAIVMFNVEDIEEESEETLQILAQPEEEFGIEIDLINPSLSPNGNYLFFTNAIDLSLWTLRIE